MRENDGSRCDGCSRQDVVLIIGTFLIRDDTGKLRKRPMGPGLCWRCSKKWGTPIRGLLVPIHSEGVKDTETFRHAVASALKKELAHFAHPLEALALQAED